MSAEEVNLDGLVGPTHNYAGLSEGNLAATRNKDATSNPRAAALQGIAKMRRAMALGLPQGVLAPQERPNLAFLRTLGFSGDDRAVWEIAWRHAPHLARAAVSASSMWAANTATVSPSIDCADGKLNFSVANLVTMLHRAQEAPGAHRLLGRIFPHANVHEALPAQSEFADEGAANHMRLCASQGGPGVEVFVYGRGFGEQRAGFPARQTLLACEAIARRHGLDAARTVFARQAGPAIEAGAFHNDVVAVAHDHVLFHHEAAFEDTNTVYEAIRRAADGLFEPVFVEVKDADVSLDEAISSYLFNAQLVRRPGAAKLSLIAPRETEMANRAGPYLAALTARADSPIGEAIYVEVRESMRNGGGPACLRLRVTLTAEERAAATQGFFLTDALADQLEAWVRAHYRDQLAPEDLGDPQLIDEGRRALDALTKILPLGSDFYPFQRP